MSNSQGSGIFYSSTSGTYFDSKQSLNEHYKSDFHRYNLRRKVAGLPPVTRTWFDARKAQLEQLEVARGTHGSSKRVWVCPLSQKKFMSSNTYYSYAKSRKFKELMKQEGVDEIPEPIIKIVQQQQSHDSVQKDRTVSNKSREVRGSGYVCKPLYPSYRNTEDVATVQECQYNGEEFDQNDEDWETASEEELNNVIDASNWEQWEVTRSLFDNYQSVNLEANVDYMFKKFGFYFPESEYLVDPEGLIRYLGAKLQYGHVPLYSRGDDENAKQFKDLQAVQNHMIDINNCKMCWEGNEDEYADFYDWGEIQDSSTQDDSTVATSSQTTTLQITNGYELAVPSQEGTSMKILGAREFSRYYKQKPKYEDTRQSVVINSIVAQYKNLGILTTQQKREEKDKRKMSAQGRQWYERNRLRKEMANNLNWNLPKNVPY
eukprot:TRINITY_DN4020_c0_g1_i1.p1 TRINITY_DN4020_c0_g1~~TRINITY_DN4020_c0_g1_i1.p1  ORF type:complete len:432 (-),score=29.62 TRINITY_DN4020_c0_g1_i1:297-1592(-)